MRRPSSPRNQRFGSRAARNRRLSPPRPKRSAPISSARSRGAHADDVVQRRRAATPAPKRHRQHRDREPPRPEPDRAHRGPLARRAEPGDRDRRAEEDRRGRDLPRDDRRLVRVQLERGRDPARPDEPGGVVDEVHREVERDDAGERAQHRHERPARGVGEQDHRTAPGPRRACRTMRASASDREDDGRQLERRARRASVPFCAITSPLRMSTYCAITAATVADIANARPTRRDAPSGTESSANGRIASGCARRRCL